MPGWGLAFLLGDAVLVLLFVWTIVQMFFIGLFHQFFGGGNGDE